MATPPQANYDWPVPGGAPYPNDLRTWLLDLELCILPLLLTPPPPTNYDQPNPRGYPPLVDLYSWASPVNLNLIGQDLFFGLAGHPNYDWPLPSVTPRPDFNYANYVLQSAEIFMRTAAAATPGSSCGYVII